MRGMRALASIGIAVAALSHGAVFAGPPPHRAVRVGISLDGPAAAASRHAPAMIAEADKIWRPYDVAIVLVSSAAIAASDVQLTLTFAPAAQRRDTPGRAAPGLGALWFQDGATPTRSLSIDADAVAATVRDAGLNGKSLDKFPPGLADQMICRGLGRVLAHEIGHFLLASPAHSTSGLMRPSFNGRVLGGFDRVSFRLDASVLPRLQARLARLESLDEPVVAASDRKP